MCADERLVASAGKENERIDEGEAKPTAASNPEPAQGRRAVLPVLNVVSAISGTHAATVFESDLLRASEHRPASSMDPLFCPHPF